MATATWRTPPPAIHPNGHGHGTKRRATDELENAQRLAKRFHLLNIDGKGKLWIQPQQSHQSQHQHLQQPGPNTQDPFVANETEYMQIEDTKDRVYINNLDDELANVSDSDDEKHMVFLPDIEKRLNKVPKSVLASNRSEDVGHGEMVLYSVPKAISIPEEEDSVRVAIMESRARARNQAPASGSRDALLHDESSQHDHDMAIPGMDVSSSVEEHDAMDLG